jgi:hypothetical protein
LLGKSNSKLLYLKIQTLNLLAKVDSKRVVELQRTIAQFYQVTDQSSYPIDKYLAVTSIELEVKNRLAKEDADYQKIKSSNNPSDYESFFNDHPGSIHDMELRSKYNQILAQRKLEAQKAADQKWRDENLPRIKKYHSKGVAMTTVGSILMAAGIPMMTEGVILWEPYLRYGQGNPYVSVALMSAGVVATLTGIIILPVGIVSMHKAIKLKNQAKERGINLSYLPSFNYYSGGMALGGGLTVKF